MTKRTNPKFVVKENATGQPWIAIEYASQESGFAQGLFGFDLKNETSYEKAQQIASYLNQNLASFNFTEL